MRRVITNSQEETFQLAEEMGRSMRGGEVIALIGDLGAGKTLFVQGLARGLGIPEEAYISSPTFTLIDSHRGRLNLHHLDLYRLSDIDELEAIGWRDCLTEDSVTAIEWADKIAEYLPPEETTIVEIEILDDEKRKISIYSMAEGR